MAPHPKGPLGLYSLYRIAITQETGSLRQGDKGKTGLVGSGWFDFSRDRHAAGGSLSYTGVYEVYMFTCRRRPALTSVLMSCSPG